MITKNRARRVPLALIGAACLCGASGGCDEAPGSPEEAFAGAVGQESEVLHRDEVEARGPASSRAPGHDDGCFGGHRPPVTVEWVAVAGGLPEIAVDFDGAQEPRGRAELQFHVVPLPVGAAGVRAVGAPVVVRGDARVRVPAEFVAAVRSGEPHVAFASFTGCDDADDCQVYPSGELHIEDGRVFSPADYQVHLREKWSAAKPWLFEDGVVTAVIDMKGL